MHNHNNQRTQPGKPIKARSEDSFVSKTDLYAYLNNIRNRNCVHCIECNTPYFIRYEDSVPFFRCPNCLSLHTLDTEQQKGLF